MGGGSSASLMRLFCLSGGLIALVSLGRFARGELPEVGRATSR
jgi:hypothetical protein